MRCALAPNQRWLGSQAAIASGVGTPGRVTASPSARSYGPLLDPEASGGVGGGLEAEPVEPVGAEAQEVWPVADRRKARLAQELERRGPPVAREVQLDRL